MNKYSVCARDQLGMKTRWILTLSLLPCEKRSKGRQKSMMPRLTMPRPHRQRTMWKDGFRVKGFPS